MKLLIKVAARPYDFAEQRGLCAQLIDRFGASDLAGGFPANAGLGEMRGIEWSRLQAKHLDHHFRQFGA